MIILNYRSPYLRRILSTNKKKNDGTLAHIKLSNILPETFKVKIINWHYYFYKNSVFLFMFLFQVYFMEGGFH